MRNSTNWFEADAQGLRELLGRRPIHFVLHELVQNALDQETHRIAIRLEPDNGLFRLTVEDDDPAGFANLRDAWTLFASTEKRRHVDRRGRFNLGEKLVICRAERAKIQTTTGTVSFFHGGRRQTAQKTEAGSIFTGWFKLTRQEKAELEEAATQILCPKSKVITFNGVQIAYRQPDRTHRLTLLTETQDAQGFLKRTRRETTIEIHKLPAQTPGWIFEMGLPVQTIEEPLFYNVLQRLPQNLDRDGLDTKLIQEIRAKCLSATLPLLEEPELAQSWVNNALETNHCDPTTTQQLLQRRFGQNAATHDPNDPEASKAATSHGYKIIPGATFSSKAWETVRKTDFAKPASALFPTPKPFSPDGTPLTIIDPKTLPPKSQENINRLQNLAEALVEHAVHFTVVRNPEWPFNATYGPGKLTWNLGALGETWFEGRIRSDQLDLLLHELGHEKASDHLAAEYHKALTAYGGKLALLTAKDPSIIGPTTGPLD